MVLGLFGANLTVNPSIWGGLVHSALPSYIPEIGMIGLSEAEVTALEAAKVSALAAQIIIDRLERKP